MDVDELDATILSHARQRWLKVAMIAAQTMQERDLGLSDEQFEIVVARGRALVARGRLVVQGNLNRPRFSEVRLPDNEGVVRAEGRDFRQ